MRSLRAGGEPISDLVRSYGVSRATIYRALNAPDLVPAPLVEMATASQDQR